MTFTTKKIAKMGVFTALPIVLKIPILQIPNVEFFTFVVFTSGFLLGIIEGGIVGALSMSIYTVFNPYGLAPIPIAIAQVLSMFIIGISGGLFFSLRFFRGVITVTFIWMGLAGLILTLLYDFLTNSGVAIVMGKFLPVMLAAVPFSLTHLISNVIIFVLLTPVLLRLTKLERRGEFA
ncbi:MAG TPA: ECF transporter S component [Terriglobales bacterium]|nr:ECF transporter S component [Terriglobales bacterium]